MISQSRYVSIISGVGAGANIAQRNLGMRVITQSTVLPPGVIAEFSGQGMATAVAAYFGTNSEEAARAAAYQGFISKSISSPGLISFARWVNTSIAPSVVGDSTTKNLAALAAITAGTLSIQSLTLQQITPIDLATATTLTQVASLLQTAIRTSTDAQLSSATVTYNTNTSQFVLTGGVVGSGSLAVILGGSPPVGTDIAALLGWGTTGAVNVPGQGSDTALTAVTKSTAISNNFGSFVFTTGLATPLAPADYTAIASWNDDQNNQYIFSAAITMANFATVSGDCIGFSGTALNLISNTLPNDYVEQSPCEILAATDYTQPNAAQNYMFYQFPARNITVSDDATANTIDALRGNYIGVTQINGQQLAFYQRGVLCGNSSTDAVDMNTYANEIWLKSAIISAIMSFFLASPQVPANELGVGQTLAILQAPINQAKTNGVISAGKTLNTQQQLFITQQSGDPNAWRQVQTIGYWVTVTFSSYVNVNNGLTEWQANYILIYAKDDAIRLVNGQDILI